MDPRSNTGRRLAGLALGFLLAGCAPGSSPTATPTTPAPAATPAVAMPAPPSTPGPAEGGTWEGRAVGADYMVDGRLYTLGANVYEGQGAFAGLTYTSMFFRDREKGSAYLVSGWIEPAE